MGAFSGFMLPRRRLLDDVADDEQESAPADFGGAVFPNPDHVRPQWDTDPIPETRLPNGVSFKKETWKGTPSYDVSNPNPANVFPDSGREISAKFSSKPKPMNGSLNIPDGTDPGAAFTSDPTNRKRLLQMVMGSDASATLDPPQNDRIADDSSRHPQGFESDARDSDVGFRSRDPEGGRFPSFQPGSTEDLESRATSGRLSLADQIRQQNQAQPSRVDALQKQYDQMKPPAPPAQMKWWQKLLLGLGGPQAVNQEYAREQQDQEFEEGRYDRQRQSLAQQIEAERRIQEQNDREDQRDTAAYSRQLAAQREQDLRTPPKTIDTDQGPVAWNPQTRGWERVSVGGQPVGAKTQKPDSLEAQYDQAVQSGDTKRARTLLDEIRQLKAAGEKPSAETGTWSIQPKEGGGAVLFNSKTGQTRPAPEGVVAKSDHASADEQRRADLARNMNENLDQLEEILQRRPELFGAYGGRMTGLKNMVGTSDPDIAKLQTIKEQMGMAMVGAHAMRNAQHVEAAANAIVNSFHNSPEAIRAAIGGARQSLGTFQQDAGEPTGSAPKSGRSSLKSDAGMAPPHDARPGMKWQHRTTNGKTEWREVPAQ